METESNIVRGPPLLKVPRMSVGQYIYEQLLNFGDNVVQVDIQTGKQTTYSEVVEKSIIVTSILKSYGVQEGDRVSFAGENHPNYLITMCGSLFLGAVWAPLNPAYTEREYRHMLEIYKPKLMFVTQRTETLLAQIVPTLNWPMKLIEVDDVALDGQIFTLKRLHEKYRKMVNLRTFQPVKVYDPSKRMAVILGSSGTTGFPKGVMLSHRNLLTFVINIKEPDYLDCRRGDRILFFLPLFHGYAFGTLAMSITTGGIAYIMRKYDALGFFKAVDDYKITHLPLVPPVLITMAKHAEVENYDFSSVREVICGAAPLQKNVWEEVQKRTNMKNVRNGYGMTELSIVSNLSHRASTDDNVGAPFPGFQCKIVDPKTGQTLATKEVGEVCFKGDQVMLGYYENPKVTADTIDEKRWCHTGDLGYLDEKGVLYITGRIKELIKYKGFQVSPSEIEEVILSYPGVIDAAVVAKPDNTSGEIPLAFVVKRPGNNQVTAEEIQSYTNGNLSPQKWLRGGVRFIESIPKTASGKILRRELVTLIPKL